MTELCDCDLYVSNLIRAGIDKDDPLVFNFGNKSIILGKNDLLPFFIGLSHQEMRDGLINFRSAELFVDYNTKLYFSLW